MAIKHPNRKYSISFQVDPALTRRVFLASPLSIKTSDSQLKLISCYPSPSPSPPTRFSPRFPTIYNTFPMSIDSSPTSEELKPSIAEAEEKDTITPLDSGRRKKLVHCNGHSNRSSHRTGGSTSSTLMKRLVKERADELKWSKFDSSLTFELNLSPDELKRS
jgi:hypothetical protein